MDDAHVLHLTRTIDAPIATVFAAWTEAAEMRRWMAPHPWAVHSAEVDAREGGLFFVEAVGPDGGRRQVSGMYLELDAGTGLVMRWRESAARDRPALDTRLAIDLREDAPGATTLALAQTGIPAHVRHLLRDEWESRLQKLEWMWGR